MYDDHPHRGAPPFVGRGAELDRLSRGLDQVGEGRGALFLLVGEPGIGKTRLADELARRAVARRMAVLWGRCWESGGAPAYWPWVQVLRTCASRMDTATLSARLRAAPELTTILPELRPHLAADAERAPLDPEQGRFRILDAATSFLRDAGRDTPLLVLLDDLHAADQSSLLLLRFVARELRDLPLVVVGAYREAEAGRDAAVGQILAEVLREGERVPLRGLSADAVSDYIAAAAPNAVTADTVEAVCAITEGNPLFLTEVVRLWVAERERHGDEAAAALTIPDEVRGAILRRLDPLPVSVRHILALAAMQGREFQAALVEQLADEAIGLSATAVSDALDEARAAGVIQPLASALGRYSFAHVLIRDVLYDALPSSERVARHRVIAAALEGLHAADLSPHLAEIAHHHALAAVDGDVDKAVEFAHRAGDRAASMLAFEDATRQFERALAVLDLRRGGLRPEDRLQRCELLLALGDAQWGAGALGELRDTYQRAAAVARQLPEAQRGPRLARAALGLGGRQQRAHVAYDQEVVRMLEEALAALDRGDSPLRARAQARLAYALYAQPDSDARRAALCVEAEAMARRIDDPMTLRWVLNDYRWALWGPATIEQRLSFSNELVQLAGRLGDREMLLDEHAWRMIDLLELGDIAAFDAELDLYARLATQHPQPWFRWYAARFEAMRAHMQGRLADAERLVETALTDSSRFQHRDLVLVYGTQMLAIRTDQGRLDELEAGVQALIAQYPAVEVWRSVLAFLYAELDRRDAAHAELERAVTAEQAALPSSYLRIAIGAYLTEACSYLNDAVRAAPLYAALTPYASRTVVVGFGVVCLGAVARYLGMLARTLGQREAAVEHFEAALATNARLGARPALARTQYEYARLLADGSAAERARAKELLDAAGAGATAMGMPSLAARVAALRAPRSPAASTAAPATQDPAAVDLVCCFRREGDYWTIGLGGEVVRLRHLRGFEYIVHLLQRPGDDVHVFDLLDLADGSAAPEPAAPARDRGDAGATIDATARAAYKARLRELREELEEAEADNDIGRVERYRGEIEELTDHLSAASGLGGRDRRAASQANRARVAVAKAIRISLARIADQQADLGRHLDLTIKTGTFCSYTPDPLRPLRWQLR